MQGDARHSATSFPVCLIFTPRASLSSLAPGGGKRRDPGNEVCFFSSPYKPTDILYPGYNYM